MLSPKEYAELLAILLKYNGEHKRRDVETYGDHCDRLQQPLPSKV